MRTVGLHTEGTKKNDEFVDESLQQVVSCYMQQDRQCMYNVTLRRFRESLLS